MSSSDTTTSATQVDPGVQTYEGLSREEERQLLAVISRAKAELG